MISALLYFFSISSASMISRTFRLKVFCWVRTLFFTTCWVMVLPPCVIRPRFLMYMSAARNVPIQSTPWCVSNRWSSTSIYPF